MAQLRVGTSGYAYAHWRGVLYPASLPRRAWLAHYATRFSTVEIDTTFYGLPTRHTVEAWRDQVPRGFVFATKLSRYGTHMKRLREPRQWLTPFIEAIEPLRHALGPILAQLPPRWHRDPGRLGDFLSAVPRGYRVAVEVRDPDWLHESVYDVLREHGAALCLHDLISAHPQVTTADWVYLRFHGPRLERPYTGGYGPRARSAAARRIRGHLAQGRDVYAYFNNDSEGHAVRDALALRDTLEDGR